MRKFGPMFAVSSGKAWQVQDAAQSRIATINNRIVMQEECARLFAAAPKMAEKLREACYAGEVIQTGEWAGMILMPREQFEGLEDALNDATGEFDAIEKATQ